MIITDILGNTEFLTGFKSLKHYRRITGEKTLSFIVLPTEQNEHTFQMVQEESIVEFKNENYRIKQVSEKSRGPKTYKEVVAIHSFFDIIDDYVYGTYTGSMSILGALDFVFAGSNYTYTVNDTFTAQDMSNFGDDNRLSLLQKILQTFGAEFTLNGTFLTFKKKIGSSTDFQFRYNFNIKTLTRDVNTNNLSTYIKGFGKQNEDGTYVVQSDYTSPNAAIFGIKHAKPVKDDRYTTLDGLNARLVAELIDEPEVSLTIDFVDLRRAGFPYDVPNEGDNVFLIYEPMGNLDLDTRIIDITEEYSEFNDYPLKTSVTLANYRKKMTDQMIEFSRTQKEVGKILDGSAKLPYSVLDDAVQRATEALQSAQTELEFTNGIIARDKTNPNNLVLFNSNGIGVSVDGGQTFQTAMTAEGMVADYIVGGTMSGDRILGGTLVGTSFRSGGLGTPIQFYVGDANTDTYKVVEITNGSCYMSNLALTINGELHSKDNGTYLDFFIGTGQSYKPMRLSATTANVYGDLNVTGNINGTTVGTSDKRLKCEIEDHTADDLQDLLNTNLINFNYLYDPIDEHRRIGFFAQDGPQDVVVSDQYGILGIDLYSLISKNIGAIKQLNSKIVELQNEIDSLKAKLAT